MSTKFAVPFLVLGLVAFGCSSSDNPNTGTAGTSGGGRGGTTGSAGRGGTTGSAGTGGATAGTGGGTAGASAGTGGGAGGTAGGAGGAGGMSTLAEVTAMCTTAPLATAGTGVFTAQDFCTLYLATCTGADAAPGYTTRASCENMFA